ncbi:hypothetical protein MC885_015237 [Smutsia gigantea]|nr:hypothetical protein MC885_015237 [Smutsia gigantea]
MEGCAVETSGSSLSFPVRLLPAKGPPRQRAASSLVVPREGPDSHESPPCPVSDLHWKRGSPGIGVSDEPLPAHDGHPGRRRRRRLQGRREREASGHERDSC